MPDFRTVTAFLTAILVGTTANATAADASRPVIGPVTLARVTPREALYIWDASTYVAQLVSDRISSAEGLRSIEASALTELADKAKSSRAATLSIKVVYSRTGAVSPVYKAATFVGIEHVCVLTAGRVDLLKNVASWSAGLGNGTVPREIKLDVTGRLPDPQ